MQKIQTNFLILVLAYKKKKKKTKLSKQLILSLFFFWIKLDTFVEKQRKKNFFNLIFLFSSACNTARLELSNEVRGGEGGKNQPLLCRLQLNANGLREYLFIFVTGFRICFNCRVVSRLPLIFRFFARNLYYNDQLIIAFCSACHKRFWKMRAFLII